MLLLNYGVGKKRCMNTKICCKIDSLKNYNNNQVIFQASEKTGTSNVITLFTFFFVFASNSVQISEQNEIKFMSMPKTW